MRRRHFLFATPAIAFARPALGQYAEVRAGTPLQFPRDHGAHPAYRTEWWYITGWVQDQAGNPFGIQVTFFRNRPGLQEDNPSAFAPKQLLFAHAAVADPAVGRLLHAQRASRAGLGLAFAETATTRVQIDEWSLALDPAGYAARIVADQLELMCTFTPAQPVLLQGQDGYSRKGPRPLQASYYYSRPHLAVRGTLRTRRAAASVSGSAWLDHEWSSEYLDPGAAGWDWTGINFDDGAALMAFRIRGKRGPVLWAGGSHRAPDGRLQRFEPGDVVFEPLRKWRSPRTGVEYPVAMRLRVRGRTFELLPLMDDQELDTRASTGTIYWEGAVSAGSGGTQAGRGYLELTGYWEPLKL
jgi:predicted secreted hydrolase